MLAINAYKINTSLKPHLLISVILAVWVFLYLFFVKPFQHDIVVENSQWLPIAIGVAFVILIDYMLLVFLQNPIFLKINKWTIGYEIAFLFLLNALIVITSYAYFKFSLKSDEYNLFEYFYNNYLPSLTLFLPIIILSRFFLINQSGANSLHDKKIIKITGKNKSDFLKINQDDLICVSNAHNYVEVFYLNNNILKTKLIRSTLKEIQTNIPLLVKIHRSHLINPFHIVELNDKNTLNLKYIDRPVSQKYKFTIRSYLKDAL